MKKQNIKFLSGLLAFGILLACTQTPEQIAEKAKNSTVRLDSYTDGKHLGSGSGFFVERDQIVTNIHVVADADKVTARLVGKETEYTIAGVVAFDAKNDLVILKTTEKSGIPLALGDSKIIQEDEPIPIVVVGNHGGVEGNVAHGTLHGTRSDKLLRLKTGVSEGGGSSGGPVLNSKGRVIGIVAGGTPYYTYAIPSTALSKIMPKKSEITGRPEIESLSDWKKIPAITAYYLLNLARRTNDSMKLNNIDEEQIKHLDMAIKSCTTAIKSYEVLKELNSSQTFAARAYARRGWLRYFRGDYHKAIEDFEKALEDFKKAIEDFGEVIELIPDYDGRIYDDIGLSKLTLGQCQSKDNEQEAQRLYEEAINNHTKSIEFNSDNAMAFYRRGIAKLTLGQSKFTLGQPKDDQKKALNLYEAAIRDLDGAIRDQGKAMELLQDYVDIDQGETFKKDYANTYHSRGYMKQMFADFHKSEGNKKEAQRLYEAAVEDCKKTIQLNPNLKASVQQIQKRAEEALEQLKK